MPLLHCFTQAAALAWSNKQTSMLIFLSQGPSMQRPLSVTEQSTNATRLQRSRMKLLERGLSTPATNGWKNGCPTTSAGPDDNFHWHTTSQGTEKTQQETQDPRYKYATAQVKLVHVHCTFESQLLAPSTGRLEAGAKVPEGGAKGQH